MKDEIRRLGFRVFMRDPSDPYCFYTDAEGKAIGYVQSSLGGGYDVSTVHIPNTTTGTGFRVCTSLRKLTSEDLQRGLDTPDWVRGKDRASVVKWRSIDHFKSASRWNATFKEYLP